jgi:hypothetical protein
VSRGRGSVWSGQGSNIRRVSRYPLVAIALLACSSGENSDTGAAPLDSSTYVLADSASVTFDLDQGRLGLDLSTFTQAALLDDGRLAVMCCNQSVVVFGADGRHLATYGGRGDGPDQFQAASMRVLPGDTILVHDRARRRAVWIDPEGGVVRSVQFRTDLPYDLATPLGVRSDGAVLVSSLHRFSDAAVTASGDTARSSAPLVALLPGSTDTLFAVADLLLFHRAPPSGPEKARTIDFVRYGGEASMAVVGDLAYVIPGGSRTLLVRGLLDGSMREVELRLPRVAVTPEQRAALVEEETTSLRTPDPTGHPPPPDLKASLRYVAGSRFADSFPVAGAMFANPWDGTLWIVHGGPRNASEWKASRVDSIGSEVSSVAAHLPGSRPLGFVGEAALIARVNGDGEAWFELRRIVPRASRAQ